MEKSRFDNIYALPVMFPGGYGSSMAYLIDGEEKIIVDSGPKQFGEDTFIKELGLTGLSQDEISCLLLTHGHADHTGGVNYIRSIGVPIAVGEGDRCWLEDHKKTFDLYVKPVEELLGHTEEQITAAYIEFEGGLTDELSPDIIIEDGALVSPGFRALSVPGHTPGSFAFFSEDTGVLLAGDNIAGGGFPGGSIPQIWDLPAYSASLDRLKELPVAGILTAHPYQTPSSEAAEERGADEVQSFIQASKDLAEGLIEKISFYGAEKGRPVEIVADEVIAAMPEGYHFVPLKDQGYASGMTLITITSALRGFCGW